jgi:hypothetical protein
VFGNWIARAGLYWNLRSYSQLRFATALRYLVVFFAAGVLAQAASFTAPNSSAPTPGRRSEALTSAIPASSAVALRESFQGWAPQSAEKRFHFDLARACERAASWWAERFHGQSGFARAQRSAAGFSGRAPPL